MIDEDAIDARSRAPGSSGTVDWFRTRHDLETDSSISISVVNAISTVTGKEPTALTPLYEAVDPDALDQLVAPLHGDELASVTVSIEGCAVTIRGNGVIDVHPDSETS